MMDDAEVVTVVDQAGIATADDPLLAGPIARAAIAQALDRRARMTRALAGVTKPKLEDVTSVIRHDASIVQAARIIYRHLLAPSIPREEKPNLLRAMYSVEDDDDRDRLEREAIHARAELDLAKADEARSDANDEAGKDDLGRLLQLAGRQKA